MCGRVRLENDYSEIVSGFRIGDAMRLNVPARYNGAPTQDFPIVTASDGGRNLTMMRWGLIPAWAKDEKMAYATFNARAEELAGKPTFRGAWKAGRRCVVPVTGFYEWQKISPKEKQPYLVRRDDGAMMGLAGLWEEKPTPAETIRSFTVITTAANAFMMPLHSRMPVILGADDMGTWLDPATPLETAAALMRQCPEDWLTMTPVDKRMGNVKNWQEEFCRPIEAVG